MAFAFRVPRIKLKGSQRPPFTCAPLRIMTHLAVRSIFGRTATAGPALQTRMSVTD
uniref:Uncharacterized protein n=1 Tax=Anguilla anguilla TaxID=7936 RepID=A0A0E9S071_ANGAN